MVALALAMAAATAAVAVVEVMEVHGVDGGDCICRWVRVDIGH